ncbi:MAG: hypothetical protein ACYSSI_00380 [Planctomycetota bacterium]|jgi:hypothetical protein
MEIHSIIDPYAVQYDTFAGDVYTLSTASITLTTGTLTAAAITDGTLTIAGGNITGMGNISGTDVDISAGTGDISTSGTLNAGQATITKMNLGGGLTAFVLNGVTLNAIVGATSQIATELQYVALQHSNTALAGSRFMLSRSRGTLANPLIVVENDSLAAIDAAAYDGTDYVLAGQIDFEVDGTPGGNDMPGRIAFKTTADGGILPAAKWTIKSTGHLLSGTDGTGNYNILTAGTLGAGAITGTSLNTGQGANELYAMNQDVQTTDNVTFNNVAVSGVLGVGTAPNAAVIIAGEKSISGSSASYGVFGGVTSTRNVSQAGPTGLDFYAYVTPASPAGNVTVGAITGVLSRGMARSEPGETNNLTVLKTYGFRSSLTAQVGSGASGAVTMTDAYNFYANAVVETNGGVITNAYAFYDAGQTAGTTNWSYYNAGGADSYFGTDNAKAMWGTTNTDLQIFSDGTNGVIDVTTALRLGNDATNYLNVNSTGDMSFVGSAGFYPRFLTQADEPAAGTGATQCDTSEMVVWKDSDDSKVYFCFNDGGTVKTAEAA